MAKAILPDGSSREYPDGTTLLEIAASIGPRLAKAAIVGEVNGELRDLTFRLVGEAKVRFITEDAPEALHVMRHSCAHIMAEAVCKLFPNTRLAIGPPIDDGYYYDFEVDRPFVPDDLAAIDAEMRKSISANVPFQRSEAPREEARRRMAEANQPLKVELVNELPEGPISFYQHAQFVDLCSGPHIPSTGRAPAFKLTHVSGAYWKGDSKNKMLQRIYAAAFAKPKELEEHLKRVEEAKKRDHRVLGKELDLFSFHEEVGAGLVHWHPKGALVRNLIERVWYDEHLKHGYQLLYTPHIASEELYKISGHLQNYLANMYAPMDIDGRNFRAKPMNCPGHIMIYKTRLHSYRELPLRMAELGTVYRYEDPGVLGGLTRVRGFTQDDAHIFCRPEQVEDEVLNVFNFVIEMLQLFGMTEYEIFVATRPEKAMGSPEMWDKATASLKNALDRSKYKYQMDEGGGAFYGPKIDLKIKDCLGRPWQCSTIQFDFNLPERFDVYYIAEDSSKQRPYMVHRALLGSMERFFGVLIEHYGGAFPAWLAPVQARVIPIADRHNEASRKVAATLREAGVRVEVDDSSERTNYKIREATLQKIPYMLVVGDREAASGQVSVRERVQGDLGAVSVEKFVETLTQRVKERK